VFFGFTDDQLAFRDAVRDLLRDACPASAVREAWGGGPGYDAKLWRQLGEMGVLGMLTPAAQGGLGLTDVDLVLILEEAGRAALPGPLVEHTTAIAALDASPLLAPAIAGDAVLTITTRTDRVGWAAEASGVLLVSGGQLRLLDVRQTTPLACVDRSRRDAAVDAVPGQPLSGDGALAVDRAVLGTAAQLCGLAAHLIDVTVAYAAQRQQFGVPIGSYQAVKHHLANAALRLEHARPAVYRAAYSTAKSRPTRGRDVSMAKVMAGDAAALAGRVALQCHGAIGYTWESDLHLWLKRVWVLERAWGSAAEHRSRVADAVLDPQS
jgi:alkylation response protein AidB-like acyl-CoA dehydrogenase